MRARELTNYLYQISVPRSLKTLNSSVFIPKLTNMLHRTSRIEQNEAMISVISNLLVPGLSRGNLILKYKYTI